MTNKEMYKRAFSPLHASGEFKEVKTMKTARPIRVRRVAVLCAAVVFVLALGSVAYAADVGGIQRQVQLWIEGDRTDAVLNITDGSYTVSYEDANGEQQQFMGGGMVDEGLGNVRPVTEEEIMYMLDMPEVKYPEDGSVWVYYHAQAVEITGCFDENGVCYVTLRDGDEVLYMTVRYQDGYSVSDSAYE